MLELGKTLRSEVEVSIVVERIHKINTLEVLEVFRYSVDYELLGIVFVSAS